MEVIAVINELLALTGFTQKQLGKRLGVSQGTISKWLNGQGEPGWSQRDVIVDMYFELKGWRSIDDKIAPYDADFQEDVRSMVDLMIKREQRGTRKR